MGKRYVTFDEIEDVLASVELIAQIAPLLGKSASYWKWVIVGAQNGLQGAMICVLAGTSGIEVLTAKSAKAVLGWHENSNGPYPSERVAEFDVLLNKCLNYLPEPLLKLRPKDEIDVRRLHSEFRNTFAHFRPMSWSIEKAGLPRITKVALNCIEVLMSHERISYKLSGNRGRRLERAIRKVRASI